ncbi:MAG: helix-turn-helix domain-containing protein [Lachnospiraceae bacterium]|nr:helix-turn-helix domain-containing protein [Lachnospiraceae bacterium]
MFTLQDFLAMKSTQNVKLLYPINTDLSSIPVKYVSVLEPPVDNFVRHYEIELSTALSIRNDFDKLDEYINKIINQGAIAIVFAFPENSDYDRHPSFIHIKEKFQNSNFPILTSPWEQKFSEITEDTMLKIWSLNQRKIKLRESLLMSVAGDKIVNSEQLLSMAESAEIDTLKLFKCIVCKPSRDITLYESNVIQENIRVVAKRMHYSIISCYDSSVFIIVLSLVKASAASFFDVETFLDKAEAKLYSVLNKCLYYWGYDDTAFEFTELKKSCLHSKTALEYCDFNDKNNRRSEYSHYNRSIVYSVLCNNNNIVRLSQNTLDALIEYDRSKNACLIETLKVYFETNYNLSETARKLFIHRQSLLYRINKIEQLCGISFKDHNMLVFLELCIHIYDGTT